LVSHFPSSTPPRTRARCSKCYHRSGITDFEGGHTYNIKLGYIGQPEHPKFNERLSRYISVIQGLFEEGKLIPNPYELIGSGGFEDALKALAHQEKGAGGNKKVLVKIQDP
jgi:hypothetical protein